MPKLSRLIIKTALAYLIGALALGIFLTPPVSAAFPGLARAAPAQLHMLVLGWLTQLIFGVAFWLFPRYSREEPYGVVWWAWAGYVALNLGLVLRVTTEPFAAPGAYWGVGLVLVVAAALQWAGCCFFAIQLWPRVRIK